MSFFWKKQRGIYLDYAATTPVSARVVRAMKPYFSKEFANPSSLHLQGQKAQAALDEARNLVAQLLGCSWKEVYFTSSATESINTVLRGAVKTARNAGNHHPHIITTAIEHSAVLKTGKDLEREGVEVTYIKVDSEGLIKPEQILGALRDTTVLVSVMYVNNEIGTIEPIQEIAAVVKEHPALVHTDAVQAANYLDININILGVDFMTLSGHKIYGPKGVGLLYRRDGLPLEPIITGGGQERGLVSGTENLPAIVGFAEALQETTELRDEEEQRVSKLRDFFMAEVLSIKGLTLNGSATDRIANNVNVCFEGKKTESLIPAFDHEGIFVSGGSACTARIPEPSHVIVALDKKECADSSIRFTLGRSTTHADIEKVVRTARAIALKI